MIFANCISAALRPFYRTPRSCALALMAAFAVLFLWPPRQASAQFTCVPSGTGQSCSNSGTVTVAGGNGSIDNGFVLTSDGSITNSGTVTASGGTGSIVTGLTLNGNGSIANSGGVSASGGFGSIVTGLTLNGNGSIANSGAVSASGGFGSNVTGVQLNGNGSISNGTVTASAGNGSIVSGVTLNGNGSITTGNVTASAGTGSIVSGVTLNGTGSINNSGIVTASAGTGSTLKAVTINGSNSAIVNSGIISALGGTAISLNGNFDSLTNIVGSRIIGGIQLGTNATVNFAGGNWLLTFNTLAGATINTNGAPFAVNGNSVAVIDPTALALEDRSVMNFTGGVSSMLQDRFNGMPVSGGVGGGGAMGFAPDAASRMDAAHEAFSGMPSISMAYNTDARNSNARAMYSKAPALAAPVYDTVVWSSGFGGERRQWEDGPLQRARDDAYGGAIGIDRQVTPDLRLGAFAGGGNSKLSVAYDIQKVDSDYVFGGGYGRWDKHNYYVDFALFGGGISSKSTRQIANNTVASGLEIATASYNGWFFSPDVTYGYRFFMGDHVITPKARVRYVGGTLDGYTEVGSAQGLNMGKRNLSDIEERLGVEFASIKPVTFGGTLKTSVEVSGLGLQRLGDSAINAVLLAQNLAFTTPGRSEAFGGVVNVGLDWRPKSNVSVYTSVEATAMSDKSFSATGKGGIRIGF
jgi:Autotransporter beta-domain